MTNKNHEQFQIEDLPDFKDPIWEEPNFQENAPEYLALKKQWESVYGLVSENLKPIYDLYPFPNGLDRQQCETSTKEFALSRMNLINKKELTEGEEWFVNLYPLPIGPNWLIDWRFKEKNVGVYPLVNKKFAYAGYVKSFENQGTIGWFIGLIREAAIGNRDFVDRKMSIFEFNEFYGHSSVFKFIKGMILLEGKLDGVESVIRDLRAYEKVYIKNVFGKVIPGRRFSYDSAFFVSKAKEVLKKEPKLKQEILVTRIGRSLRAFQMDVKNEGYKDFKALKADVLKK